MSFRFSIDGQVYDIVHASQSGHLIHQRQVSVSEPGEVEAFVDKLLAQNDQTLPELRHYLSLSSQESPKPHLIDQLLKGRLKLQTGSLSHIGGPARAPQATARNTGNTKGSSLPKNVHKTRPH